jgi:hypothetical protein
MKTTFKTVAVSTACLTFLSVYKTNALPVPCDTNWFWGTLPSQPPQDFYGPIADIGGVVYVVGANANGVLALMGYSSQRWYTYATFNNGGVSVMATYGNTLYIGGPFEGFLNSGGGVVNATNVAALNTSNGQWTPIGIGTPIEQYGNHAAVQSMTVDSAGLLYVGLDQTAPADPTTGLVGMLVKWDTVGQQWVSVGGGFHIDAYNNYCGNPPIRHKSPPNFGITALTSSGTDIYVAGYFDQCGSGSVTTYHVARWIASSQSWVPLAPNRDWCYFYSLSAEPYISSLLVSGSLYVAGNIVPNCNGTAPQGVAEFSTTGGGLLNTPSDNLWGDYFDSQGVTGYDPGVGYALVKRNCAVYVAGAFRSIGSVGGPSGVQAWGIAKKVNGGWLPLGNGLSWPDPNTGLPTWGIGSYLATDQLNDTNHVYVQGSFDTAGSLPANNFAVWQGPAAVQPPPPPDQQ